MVDLHSIVDAHSEEMHTLTASMDEQLGWLEKSQAQVDSRLMDFDLWAREGTKRIQQYESNWATLLQWLKGKEWRVVKGEPADPLAATEAPYAEAGEAGPPGKGPIQQSPPVPAATSPCSDHPSIPGLASSDSSWATQRELSSVQDRIAALESAAQAAVVVFRNYLGDPQGHGWCARWCTGPAQGSSSG